MKAGSKLSPGRTEVEDRAVLRIRGVTADDAGEYRCAAENIAGAIQASAFLQIQSEKDEFNAGGNPKLLFSAPPVFLVEPEDKVTKPGAKLTLDCRLEKSGAPALQFWLRDGQAAPLLPGTEGRLAVSSQGSLSIGPITARDAGWYGCFGVSSTGSSGSMAWVGMKEGGLRPPPIIQLGPVNQTLVAGGQAELHCQTSAGREQAAQVVTWLKEGLPLEFPATERFFLGGGNNLHIRGEILSTLDTNLFNVSPLDLQLADSGLYTCQVRTQSGQTSASAYLAVEDEAEEGHKLPPPPDLLAFPASPSKPELVEVGEGSITVRWGKPHRVGASPLRGYQVEHFTSGGVGHWVAAQVQGETFTLTEVLLDAVLVFLVRARNEHGLSPPSLLSDQLSLEGELGDSKARQKTEMLRQLSTKQVELNEVATIGPRKAKLSWKVIVIAVISSI